MAIEKRGDGWRVRWRDKDGVIRSRQCPTLDTARKVEDAIKNAKALDEEWGRRRGGRARSNKVVRTLQKTNAQLRAALRKSPKYAATASASVLPPTLAGLAGHAHDLPIIPMISGVYFLVFDDVVVYVGQSIHVMARVAWHTRDKIFDRAFYVPVDPKELDAVEGAFIRALAPKWNGRTDVGKSSDDAAVLAKYGWPPV